MSCCCEGLQEAIFLFLLCMFLPVRYIYTTWLISTMKHYTVRACMCIHAFYVTPHHTIAFLNPYLHTYYGYGIKA